MRASSSAASGSSPRAICARTSSRMVVTSELIRLANGNRRSGVTSRLQGRRQCLTTARIDPVTGNLIAGGKPVFPIGLSDPPPVGATAPGSGAPAWDEIAAAGVNFVRNYTVWTAGAAAEQMIPVLEQLDAARAHELQVWLALAGVDNDLSHQAL